MSADEKPDNVVPLRKRQPSPPKPRPIETCPHGVPLVQDCAECHSAGDDGPQIA
jgi:hypothetical protein